MSFWDSALTFWLIQTSGHQTTQLNCCYFFNSKDTQLRNYLRSQYSWNLLCSLNGSAITYEEVFWLNQLYNKGETKATVEWLQVVKKTNGKQAIWFLQYPSTFSKNTFYCQRLCYYNKLLENEFCKCYHFILSYFYWMKSQKKISPAVFNDGETRWNSHHVGVK